MGTWSKSFEKKGRYFGLILKKLIADGRLDKHGKPLADTPKDWVIYYIDENNNNILQST